MKASLKTGQLQLRVSAAQKAAIAREARQAGMTMSDWILSRILPDDGRHFQQMLAELDAAAEPGFVLAEINEWLVAQPVTSIKEVLSSRPEQWPKSSYRANYLAAMIEEACRQKGVSPPLWLCDIKPLAQPHFISTLKSIRLHLLRHSPPAFRNRNIFIDASIGARV